MTTKAIIFDLDGTLVSLPIDYSALYAAFREIIGIKNIEPLTETVAALNDDIRRKIFETWTRAEFAILPKMTVVKEGMELYQQYSRIPRALVTMQGKETVEKILRNLNLSFQAVMTREDSLDRAAQIMLALKKLRLEPKNVVVIADRATDKIAAKKIGCKFMMVKK
ncbi:MAG TPA: HAD-IA family hydrolase [Candidatus Bathyarchaeia archaeon]|nr:HAD-IA family hydrolase [Candidatus Bathyarchaeia archaeon]